MNLFAALDFDVFLTELYLDLPRTHGNFIEGFNPAEFKSRRDQENAQLRYSILHCREFNVDCYTLTESEVIETKYGNFYSYKDTQKLSVELKSFHKDRDYLALEVWTLDSSQRSWDLKARRWLKIPWFLAEEAFTNVEVSSFEQRSSENFYARPVHEAFDRDLKEEAFVFENSRNVALNWMHTGRSTKTRKLHKSIFVISL